MLIKSINKFNETFHKSLKFGSFTLPKQNLDIEIGCGVGLHPIVYALENPNRNLLAIEHTLEKFKKFKRRFIRNLSPKNLFPIHANAISFITSKVEDATIDNIFILYPNPNPLGKHANKRFHNMPFMEILLKKLKDGGKLIIASNEEFYIKEAIEVMCGYWGLKLLSKKDLLIDSTFRPRTHFEIKYLKRKESCLEVIFAKVYEQ